MDLEWEYAKMDRVMARAKPVVRRLGFGLGALVLVYGALRWGYDAHVFARMEDTTCTLVSKRVESKLRGGSARRGTGRVWYEEEGRLIFGHRLGARTYMYTATDLDHEEFEKGRTYPCRYDPQDPRRITLASSFEPDTDVFWLGAGLLLIGVYATFGRFTSGRRYRA